MPTYFFTPYHPFDAFDDVLPTHFAVSKLVVKNRKRAAEYIGNISREKDKWCIAPVYIPDDQERIEIINAFMACPLYRPASLRITYCK